MKNRITVSLPSLLTREDAESAMTELAQHVNNRRKLITKRDGQILAINKDYEQPLAALDDRIETTTDTLRAWAESTPDAFPKGRKSLDLVSGIIGFRTGMPRLALLSRAFNWERVLHLVEQFWPACVRLKKEVDKEQLLSLHAQAEDKPAAEAELKRLGLKVVQDETFFIDPKLTDTDTRQTEAA